MTQPSPADFAPPLLRIRDNPPAPLAGWMLRLLIGLLAVGLVGSVFLMRTIVGRHVFAVGGNAEASRYSGVPIGRVKVVVYLISGLTAGLAAFMGASFYGSASCADAKRRSGVFSNRRVTISASAGGTSGRAVNRSAGCSCRIA